RAVLECLLDHVVQVDNPLCDIDVGLVPRSRIIGAIINSGVEYAADLGHFLLQLHAGEEENEHRLLLVA
ncbi:hypothetical protein PENTCL1PPCAC_14706, partial [Pristionchus entomophagus]